MLMVNGAYFRTVKAAAEQEPFQTVIAVTEEQIERQRHMEFAVRFLVHSYVPYDGTLDVEEYIDEGIVKLARQGDSAAAEELITRTFALLKNAAGKDALRRLEGGLRVGKVGLVGLEGIAVGVAKNLDAILALEAPQDFTRSRIQGFWGRADEENCTILGLRGTTRIQRTVPLGEAWFRP
jgi:hypothetical protein